MLKKDKKKEVLCDLCPEARGLSEAICITCNLFACLKCCISHSQTNPGHLIKEIASSAIEIVSAKAKELEQKLGTHLEHIRKSRAEKHPQQLNVNPEVFEKYLNEIQFIKKEVQQTVERFFEELSLEFVTMWEQYLVKFSSGEAAVERMTDLLAKLNSYGSPEALEKSPDLIKTFLSEHFEEKVAEMLGQDPINDPESLPSYPRLTIKERMLSELEEVLCTGISTINYRYIKDKGIKITVPNSLDKVEKVPIIPLKASFFFQYNLQNNGLEVLEIDAPGVTLPTFPKSLILKNGLLHIVGGAMENGEPSSSHFSFNQAGQLVLRKAIPKPRNPVNALVEFQNRLYLVGGQRNKGEWSSECWYYNIAKDEWTTIDSMARQKPQQSLFVWKDELFVFGISLSEGFVNIEALDLKSLKWRPISLRNYLSNPFNFAACFTCIPINEEEVLFFGGKKYEESFRDPSKRLTDQNLSKQVYTFSPETLSFARQDCELISTGVSYGEVNPLVFEGRVFSFQFVLAKVSPITRWFQTMQVLTIKNESEVESLLIMQE